MKKVVLDFSDIYTKEELFLYLKNKFDFPDYFGNNLDALHDCLAEYSDCVVSFKHFDILKANLGEYADIVRQVFLDVMDVDFSEIQ